MDPFITPIVTFVIVLGWLICTRLDERAKWRRDSKATALDQLKRHEVEACKHPEESLLEIRSDVFTKGELVATLCTACDGQLGPEVWQAVMDRRFDEWTREHQTKLELDAAREAKNAELRAEQADLAALETDVLQYLLADAKEDLSKMKWGVSGSQDRKRTELAANCKKWRGELERRGIKEVPSWKRRLEEKLLPKREFSAGGIVADEIYLPVLPKFDFVTEMLKPQVEAVAKRNDELIAKTFQLQLLEEHVEQTERDTQALLERAAVELYAWGQAEPVARIEQEEAMSFSRMIEVGWRRAGSVIVTDQGWYRQKFFLDEDHSITCETNFRTARDYDAWRIS